MKLSQQAAGIFLAGLTGIFLPVAATIYEEVCGHNHGSQAPWPSSLWSGIEFVAFGSAFVGLFVGILGVGVLHLTHRAKLKDYALTGFTMGAATGAFFTFMTHIPGDPAISWVIFITLPALSMAFGFISYWSVCIRAQRGNNSLPPKQGGALGSPQ